MSVHAWPMRIRTRVFRVFYAFNLDDAVATEGIKMGVFGDLRMGERYALGLIARSKVDPLDIEHVGRLGQPLMRNPYSFLRQTHEEISGRPRSGAGLRIHRSSRSSRTNFHMFLLKGGGARSRALELQPERRWRMSELGAWIGCAKSCGRVFVRGWPSWVQSLRRSVSR